MGRLKWMGAAVLCGLAGAVGCSAEAQIGGRIEAPAPPPPPPADSDGDGIADPDDKCPQQKEDGKPPDPNDGCPNLDEDGDGILIPQDKCPTEPETKNDFEDDDGCPDTKPLVQVVGTKVQINQKILFDKGKATITADSMKVVEAVADVLKKNAQIELVEVGGHASKEGPGGLNRTLTQKRVDSVVKELVKLGVEQTRLISQGYGFYCLVSAGTTEEEHEKNRRVEFRILHQGGAATEEVGKRGCADAEAAGIKPKALPEPKKAGAAPAADKKADAAPAADKKADAAPAADKKADAAPAAAPAPGKIQLKK